MIFVIRLMQHFRLMAIGIILLFGIPNSVSAQNAESTQAAPKKTFNAVLTDIQGIETDVNNIYFYWEEKLSETAFVPHEIREVPVTRGTAMVKVKFDTIQQIDIRKGPDTDLPLLSITLTNGKTGEFKLAIPGTFRGGSDFGEVEFQPAGLTKIIFK